MKRLFLKLCLVVLAAGAVSGCVTSPYAAEHKARSDALLAQQTAQAKQQLAQDAAPRLILAAIALDDRSEAFQRDVLLAEKWALAIDARAVVFKLANPAWGKSPTLPFATPENARSVVRSLGALARPQDKVLLVLSSHGSPGRLSVHGGSEPLGVLASAELARWMQPLRPRQTVVVISACFSGSFIPDLAQEEHIVLTAAAKDRSSFGCQFKSDNTYFIGELFGQALGPSLDWHGLMAAAQQGVERREQAMHLAPPSNPQAFYGEKTKAWSQQPIAQWLGSR